MKIHILGVCGTFMGGIALLARELGHEVSGSDRNAYPPMSDLLKGERIPVLEGYSADHLSPSPDLVLVGNALSRGNACVERVLNEAIPYVSGPEWLAREVLPGRHVLAVSGTHGKTTGSAMLAWILESAGRRPGFLIGGLPRNFSRSARVGEHPCFIVEADEYDSAFFDKRSKFVHYRPRTLVINNIEYDHADIFADLEAIRRQFHHLVRTIPSHGRLVVNGSDPEIKRVLDMGCWTPVTTFGAEAGDWNGRLLAADASRFEVHRNGQSVGVVSWQLSGRHNLENGLAAIAAAEEVGIDPARSCSALSGFLGVARRLQHIGDPGGVHVYDDFAHHPTAIAATLAALRSRVGRSRILAVLEPRSNTMRMGVHRERLPAALAAADEVFLYCPPGLAWEAEASPAGVTHRWRAYATVDQIILSVAETARSGDNVLIMSNGGFEGIQARLLAKLAA